MIMCAKLTKTLISFVLIIILLTEHLFFSVFAIDSNKNNITKSLNITQNKIIKNKINIISKDNIIANIATGTIIKSKDQNEKIDFSKMNFSELNKKEIKIIENELGIKNIKYFNFGISGKNLIFSKPVKITIPIEGKKSSNFKILTKDNGNNIISSSSLSLDQNTSCKKGISSISEKNILPSIKEGKISFFTCSASNFIIIEQNTEINKENEKKISKKKYQRFLTQDKNIKTEVNINSKVTLTATGVDFKNGDITVELDSGIKIKNKNPNSKINPSLIGISEARKIDKDQVIQKIKDRIKTQKNIKNFNGNNIKTFEFGIIDQPLIFSKPVKITLPANLKDGSSVEIFVKHAGDSDFGISGLSSNPNSTCNPDGTINTDERIISPIVKNGKVEFYTCSASSFTMNTGGGTSGSNDLKLVIGDCGQFQLSYNGANNVWTGNPPATGCNNTLDSWIALRIGGTTYWSDSNNWTTRTTTGGQNGNTYTGTTTLTRTVTRRTYTLILNRKYVAPNKYFTINYSVNIPTGNTNNVKFYLGNDSTVGGADANDVGYYNSGTTTVGAYDNVLNQLSAIKYLSGASWTSYEVGPYATINSRISGGTDFNNTIQTTPGDIGFGVNWNFGTTPGTRTGALEWRVNPYVSTNVPDLIPGIGIPDPQPMQVGVDATLPIVVSNVGNANSTGSNTVVLSYSGALISGPLTSFTSNGWSCGAESGSTVTCNKTTDIAPFVDELFYIIVRPKPAASGLTTRFDVNLTNASDSNNTNNSAFSNILVAIQPAPNDTSPPIISSITPLSGSLSPVGIKFSYYYYDTGSLINQSSATGTLSKWNGISSWIVQTGALTPFSITSTGATFSGNNLTYGKYKFDVSIQDNTGNTATGTSIFYLDQPELIISTGSLDIGELTDGTTKFSSNEIIITAKTVGAPFQIILNKISLMQNSLLDEIIDWNLLKGVGYDKFNYSGNISKINSNEIISSQTGSINSSGNLNTYIYKIKMGALIDAQQSEGIYQTNLSFGMNLNY